MPHQCVRCGELYGDGTASLLTGCTKCGGKFFFFIKKSSIERAKKITKNLTPEEKDQIEKDIKEVMEQEYDESPEVPVFVDIENIRVSEPGKFEINIVDMFNKKPLVCKVGEGKYIIDLISTFKSSEKGKQFKP